MNYIILLVDDEKDVLHALERFLKREGYHTISATSGEEGLKKINNKSISMVISDLRMPGMDGIEFLKKVREISPETLRIILSGHADLKAALRSINVGEIFRFITKPWDPEELKEVVLEGLSKLDLTLLVKNENVNLKKKVTELQQGLSEGFDKIQILYGELKNNYLSTITSLAAAVEAKDPYTRGHSEMVSSFAASIARKMGLPRDTIDGIQVAGILHDIGKIGISEKILLKPGKLTTEEKKVMETHPVLGAKILEPVNFPWETISHVYHHHERYDGKGYPVGLKGKDIPLVARIISVADTYQAMTSNRAYRKALPKSTAVRILKESKGTQLDPEITAVFIDLLETVPDSIFQVPEILMKSPGQKDNTILIIDHEDNILSSLNRVLLRDGLKILSANNSYDGLKIMEQESVSLVILDIGMLEMSGTEFLQKVKELYPDTVCIILTSTADIKSAIEVINKSLAYKYISKPWSEMDVRHLVQQGLNHYFLQKRSRILNEDVLEKNKNLILI